MPRKDPITGCMVMTNAEFWNDEAEREGQGRTGGDLMEDFSKEMAAEEEKERQRYFDPEFTLAFIRSLAAEDLQSYRKDLRAGYKSEKPHIPVVILSIEFVSLRQSFKSNTVCVIGTAICKDQITRKFCASCDSFSGDFYEPPSEESNLTWNEMGWIADFKSCLKKMKCKIVPHAVRKVGAPNWFPKTRYGLGRRRRYYDWVLWAFFWKPYEEWEC